MIQFVFRPVKAPVVRHEGLYGMYMNGNLLLHVRARNARHAEEKVKFLVVHELRGKVITFDLDKFADEFRQLRKFWAERVLRKKEDGSGDDVKRNVEEVLQPGWAEGLPAGHGAGDAGGAGGTCAVHDVKKGE